MSKCIFCKGELIDTIDTFEEKIKGNILIRNVPCRTCENCGEKTFDRDTWIKLSEIIDRNKGESGVIDFYTFE